MKAMKNEKPSFEQAMNAAVLWCTAWESGELSDEVLADRVSELISTLDGARGFFVIGLASDCPLLDRLPESLVQQLRLAGEVVVDLTVRNLAMSTAMAVHHHRNENESQKAGSERISTRCIQLLRLLEPNLVKKRLEKLLEAINGKGEDTNFLKRWNYDAEQQLAIASSIHDVAER